MKKYLDESLHNYFKDYVQTFIRENNLEESSIEEYLKNPDFLNVIKDDLDDKGFSKSEIDEIINNNMNKLTGSKFLAYYILLTNSYNTQEEMNKIITDDLGWSIEDFSEDDLYNILKCSKNIDF